MIPLHDEDMRTTNPDVYVAGDISGIEEASTAMEEGRLAGTAAAEALGYLSRRRPGRRRIPYAAGFRLSAPASSVRSGPTPRPRSSITIIREGNSDGTNPWHPHSGTSGARSGGLHRVRSVHSLQPL